MAVNKEKSKGLGVGDRTNDGTIGQATQQHRNSRSPGAREEETRRCGNDLRYYTQWSKIVSHQAIDNKSKDNRILISIAAGAAAESRAEERKSLIVSFRWPCFYTQYSTGGEEEGGHISLRKCIRNPHTGSSRVSPSKSMGILDHLKKDTREDTIAQWQRFLSEEATGFASQLLLSTLRLQEIASIHPLFEALVVQKASLPLLRLVLVANLLLQLFGFLKRQIDDNPAKISVRGGVETQAQYTMKQQ